MDRSGHQPQDDARPEYLRTRVTNGREVLPNVDGRSLWVRRLRDLIAAYTADLGGDDAISESERSIVRRIATQVCSIERLEAKMALEGEASARDIDLHQRLSNTLRRNQEALGLKRRSRDITPSLDQYLARQA
jgi:hypothetical protein